MTKYERETVKEAIGLLENLLPHTETGSDGALGSFPVVVSYKTPTYDELKEQFDWVSPAYEDASLKGEKFEDGKVTFDLVHFDKDLDTEEAKKALEDQGYRPATFEELVAFAKAYPDEQRKHFIVVLGSVWRDPDGDDRVACLDQRDRRRDLYLFWAGNGWGAVYRFLAVRK